MKARAWLLALGAALAFTSAVNGQARPPSQRTGPITIFGEGSSGPASGLSATPEGLSVSRTLAQRFGERLSVIDAGVDMSGSTDSAAAMEAALSKGKPVTAPCGTIRVTRAINVTAARTSFTGSGDCTKILYDAPVNTPIQPVLNIKSSAVGSSFSDFLFDHQAQDLRYQDPTIYGGNLIAGSAVLVQADNVSISRVSGTRGYDNCIAVVQLPENGPSYEANPGQPRNYSLQTIRTSSCGLNKYRAGAGVDIGSGSGGVVNDLIDRGSYGAFILDIGAGAQGTFSNLTGIGTAFDAALFAQNGTRSQTFFIGSADSTFSNLTSIDAYDRGMWIDFFADRTIINGLNIKTSAKEGAIIKASNVTMNSVIVNSPGYGGPSGAQDALVLDTSAGDATSFNLTGFSVRDQFVKARYGLNKIGGGVLRGYAIGTELNGAVNWSNDLGPDFGLAGGVSLGGGWTTYTPTLTCSGGALGGGGVQGSYRAVGKTIDFQVNLTISDKGSCSGAALGGLPFAPIQRVSFVGADTGLTGSPVAGVVDDNTNIMKIKKQDGTTPFVNGTVLTIGGTYQAR